MTREEAKKRLAAFRDYLCAGNPIWDVDECREAFDTAILSLEAWDEVLHEIGSLGLAWEYGEGVRDCYDIIKKHLEEVEE